MRVQHLHKSQSPPCHSDNVVFSLTPVSQAYKNTEFSPVGCYEVHVGNLISKCK